MRIPTTLSSIALIFFSVASLMADPLREQLVAARAGEDTDAEREITLRLLLREPHDVELLVDLAKLQLAAGEHQRCEGTLARLGAALGKPDAELYELRGDLTHATAQNTADRERAAEAWQAALALEPERLTSLVRLANHHRRANNRPAEALYRARLAALRNHPDDHVALARAAVARRDWTAAIKHNALLSEHHANSKVAKDWAATHDRLMENSTALAALDSRLEATPGSVETLLGRAWLFDAIGIDELALADARHAHKLRPTSFAVRYRLSVIMAHAGQWEEAGRQFGIDAGRYVYKRRRPDETFFDRITTLEPDIENGDPGALAERSTLLRAEGQKALALADATRAVVAAPDLPAAQLALARCESDADHTAAAKTAYAAVLELDGNHLDALEELGRLHMKLGDYAEAASLFARHLQLDPENRLAKAHARCLAALQKPRH